MKTNLLILLFSVFSFAQIKHEKFNFYLLDKEVYWQNTFEKENTTKEELFTSFEQYVIQSIIHENLRVSENTLSFIVSDVKLIPKDYGYKVMSTPIFVQYFQQYLCVVDFKDNKYRITIKNISFTNKQPGLGFFNDKLEDLILDKKSENFKKHKNVDISFTMLENFYNSTYNIQKIFSKKQDW